MALINESNKYNRNLIQIVLSLVDKCRYKESLFSSK